MPSFSALCADLQCPLTNFRDRWSAYNNKLKRGVFTIWTDRLPLSTRRYIFGESGPEDTRVGARDLRAHIQAVMRDGGTAYGIVSEAADIHAGIRKRKRFDADTLLVLRFAEEGGTFVAYVVGESAVAELRRRKGEVIVSPLTDAVEDLPEDPAGASRPEKGTGSINFYRRDAAIRRAVLLRARGVCEYCGVAGFQMSDGRRYIEAHHIINLAKQGPDTMDNVIGLCANHHREAHFGLHAEEFERDLKHKLATIRGKAA